MANAGLLRANHQRNKKTAATTTSMRKAAPTTGGVVSLGSRRAHEGDHANDEVHQRRHEKSCASGADLILKVAIVFA
jgi:hypothetical protein